MTLRKNVRFEKFRSDVRLFLCYIESDGLAIDKKCNWNYKIDFVETTKKKKIAWESVT